MRETHTPLCISQAQPFANTKQSSVCDQGNGHWQVCDLWVHHTVRVQLWGHLLCCPLEVVTIWFYSCSLVEMSQLKPPPSSSSLSISTSISISSLPVFPLHLCFHPDFATVLSVPLGTHTLKFNFISHRYATCKCADTVTFRIEIFIDLLGFNLFLAYLKKKRFVVPCLIWIRGSRFIP